MPVYQFMAMTGSKRRIVLILAILVTSFLIFFRGRGTSYPIGSIHHPIQEADPDFVWRRLARNYPYSPTRTPPRQSQGSKPGKIQFKFPVESSKDKQIRLNRQKLIKDAFVRGWTAYKKYAWLKDEVTPISAKSKDTFGGWGATLIDSLDTLWIMDMKSEFQDAVAAVSRNITFESTQADEINVFETTIRFLGGLISAYDLSGDQRLLIQARNVGDMIYKAFDTPNHLPVTRWNLQDALDGNKQTAHSNTLLAEIGSMAMEFTRLSLITNDNKYYDAVEHITELLAASQSKTKLPGMWPILVNAADEDFDAGSDYALGAMADSTYEYFSKMVALLNNRDTLYAKMHQQSMRTARESLLFRALTPDNQDILFAGVASSNGKQKSLETSSSHLTCFTGGMFALGGKLLANNADIDIGAKITRGCVWAYSMTTTGVMPETMHLAACENSDSCNWSEKQWKEAIEKEQNVASDAVQRTIDDQRLPKGFTKIPDGRYILRPEAIESVFIMYRITGDSYWTEKAWEMWQAINALTRTNIANSAVWDVNPDPAKGEDSKADSMESFWMGETLKYFYLIFSEPELINLDQWVFNTEAHPFRRLV